MKYGFVKILSGKNKGRIARFVRISDNKAVISYSYLIDFAPYSYFDKVSLNAITIEIKKTDLLNRYYDLSIVLDEIDHTANKEIKKYSVEHQNLILELSLVKQLIKIYFSFFNTLDSNFNKNTLLISSFKDYSYINDFLLEFEYDGCNTHLLDFEEYVDIEEVKKYLNKFKNICIFLTNNSKEDNLFNEIKDYLKQNQIDNSNIYYISNISKDSNVFYINDIYDEEEDGLKLINQLRCND